MADQRKTERPKSRAVWQLVRQNPEREHKAASDWLNDMMVESKDG